MRTWDGRMTSLDIQNEQNDAYYILVSRTNEFSGVPAFKGAFRGMLDSFCQKSVVVGPHLGKSCVK